MFEALEVSLEWLKELRPVLGRLKRVDSDLERQMRRAAMSVASNLSEGRLRAGKDRRHLWRIAGGSLAEARTQLKIAEAMGYEVGRLDRVHELADRVAAMTWRLTH